MRFIGILVQSQVALRIRCNIPTHSLTHFHNALIANHEVSKTMSSTCKVWVNAAFEAVNGENRPLVTDETVEVKK
jgi:hypothetical protein